MIWRMVTLDGTKSEEGESFMITYFKDISTDSISEAGEPSKIRSTVSISKLKYNNVRE